MTKQIEKQQVFRAVPYFNYDEDLKKTAFKFLYSPDDTSLYNLAKSKNKSIDEQEASLLVDQYINNFKMYVLGFDEFKEMALTSFQAVLDTKNDKYIGLCLYSLDNALDTLVAYELYEIIDRHARVSLQTQIAFEKWSDKTKQGVLNRSYCVS